ncbi:hypothetical protein [Pelagibius sp. Alg239-R121]|uniref:hypothetical protein n=1 Tax=Pelagibius sp. Alg239-R121 TaxID=2993448 RepID=UPI0024A60F64|nr:hypothetical protein [Pelagibius sp. Alg239-R121]
MEAPDIRVSITQAIEQAAISGLCREGQLEIAAQEARRLRPGLDETAVNQLVDEAYRCFIEL